LVLARAAYNITYIEGTQKIIQLVRIPYQLKFIILLQED